MALWTRKPQARRVRFASLDTPRVPAFISKAGDLQARRTRASRAPVHVFYCLTSKFTRMSRETQETRYRNSGNHKAPIPGSQPKLGSERSAQKKIVLLATPRACQRRQKRSRDRSSRFWSH
ncbi:MAG: hypothetical protein MHM6MM_007385 [Cercozoa sp. M6MM]